MYNKQQLYNHIIRNISKTVKQYINEAFDFGAVKQNKAKVLHKNYHGAIVDGLKDEFKKYLIDMEDRVKDKYRKTMVTTQEPIYYKEKRKLKTDKYRNIVITDIL